NGADHRRGPGRGLPGGRPYPLAARLLPARHRLARHGPGEGGDRHMSDLFPGFDTRRIKTFGAEIHLRSGGDGPPLLLLHGYPQCHAMWHRVAPALAERFTVIVPDLRGYGDSSCP